jgi:hypothetical protein
MNRYEDSLRHRAALAAFAVFMFCGLTASATAQNAAQGSITVNGVRTELGYAYAYTATSLHDKKPETRLILADKALPAKAVTDTFERMRAQRDGVKTLEFTFAGDKSLSSVQFAVDSMNGGGSSTAYKAALDALDARGMKGRVYTDGEQTMFRDRYSFDVRFDVAMTVQRAPEATGKAAWSTPQGVAIAEYLRAARAGDKAALKRVILPERGKDLDGPQGREILQFLKLSANPKTAEFGALTVDGDTAKAEIIERSKDGSSSSRYSLKLVGGEWKVDP